MMKFLKMYLFFANVNAWVIEYSSKRQHELLSRRTYISCPNQKQKIKWAQAWRGKRKMSDTPEKRNMEIVWAQSFQETKENKALPRDRTVS
jgi:hypothetical protein